MVAKLFTRQQNFGLVHIDDEMNVAKLLNFVLQIVENKRKRENVGSQGFLLFQ